MKKTFVLLKDNKWCGSFETYDLANNYLKENDLLDDANHLIIEVDINSTFIIIGPVYSGHAENVMYPNGRLQYKLPEDPAFFDVNNTKGLVAYYSEYFYPNIHEPYINGLKGKFTEISEDRYYEMLEVLPPMKWHDFKDINIFFLEEAFMYTLHSCYIKKGKKYYKALRDITETDEEIYDAFISTFAAKIK